MALALVGCEDDPEPAEAPASAEVVETTEAAEEAPIEAPAPSALGALMREHFVHARDARNALVAGDGDAARQEMQWLAAHDPTHEEMPEGMRERFQAMRDAAAAFAEVSALTDAGEAYGKMLNACGSCHTTFERGPQFATPPLPEGEGVVARMRLHRWAADRMWEGLVVQDAELFNQGASELSRDPLRAEDLPEGALEPERIQGFADHVHTLSERAATAEDEDGRAVIYGNFLATCAACHRALGMTELVRAATQ